MKLTDAGLETVLVFDEGIDLPHFAAFPLVDSEDGRTALRRYYGPFVKLARDRDVSLVLSAPTWRANTDWGRLLGYEGDDLAGVNARAVSFVESVRDEILAPAERGNVVVEGSVGPRSDAYHPTLLMDADEAERYHAVQLRTFADAGCAQATALSRTRIRGLRANASKLSHAASSTRRKSSTRAIRPTWRSVTSRCGATCPTSRSSAAAAARTSAT
jgi:homocysteine S-methyltransferase